MRRPENAPTLAESLTLLQDIGVFQRVMASGAYRASIGDRYYHWSKLRFRTPPADLSQREWWAGIKLARQAGSRTLPLVGTNGLLFRLSLPDPLLRQLSEIDRSLSGRAQVSDELTNSGTRDRYLMSALIEESITSSQLEGAATTREVASDMLRSGRPPRTAGERMITNNFNAMRYIRTKIKEPLTPELVCEIHREVTQGTLRPGESGKLRTKPVRVIHEKTGEVLHEPPLSEQLEGRLKSMCAFANSGQGDPWVHPILRAIFLHFWLGFDHPFVDGNGRTARALFYWYMLKADYKLCEFISISEILRNAPSKYAMAYLYTETDENDATYFALYHLAVLQRAVEQLHMYVAEKMKLIQAANRLLRQCGEFNYRQIALLGHALRNPDHPYSVTSHATSHMVSRPTARKDLIELAKHGFLSPVPSGKSLIYLSEADLDDRLASFGRKRGVRRRS